ncbi:hypothetical protein, partial [Inquilinus limosus]|uniref:hypothetical protein n=1 Tax=Inquilinus limosus TaxID=171674 RepID=UPI001376D9FA
APRHPAAAGGHVGRPAGGRHRPAVLHSATTVTVEAETPLSPDPIRIEADRYTPDLPAVSVGDPLTLRLPPPFVFPAER